MQSSQENSCTGVPWTLTLQETFEVGYATIRSETLRVGHDAIQSGAFLLGYVAIRTSEVGVELVPMRSYMCSKWSRLLYKARLRIVPQL